MIEVIRNHGDLEREVWRFGLILGYDQKLTLSLNFYSKQDRKTTRHKFREANRWDSFDERYYRSPIKRVDVPEPDDVINEALCAVCILYKPLDKEARK